MAAATDEKIGGFRFVRTIHPGATSVVMEVLAWPSWSAAALEESPAWSIRVATVLRKTCVSARIG